MEVSQQFAIWLVGHWALDDGTGTTATDWSQTGDDGTLHGASWITGHIGSHAASFSSTDYIEVPTDPALSEL